MTGFILKDEFMLLSLISVLCQVTSLLMELPTYFNIWAKDGVIPRVLTLPCFPGLTYLMLQKGNKQIFFEQQENAICAFSGGIILI